VRQFIEERQLEYECYSDIVLFANGTYSFHLVFALQDVGTVKPLALVRMSPEHAKVFAIMLKRTLKQWEEQRRLPIAIPPNVLEERHIDLETEW
jgi:hypothetical protein